MDEDETTTVELDDIETDETDDGSFLATAVVFGVGTLVGAAATRGYGKAKELVQTRIAARRALKAVEEDLEANKPPADEAE
jgi:hypothetical protein